MFNIRQFVSIFRQSLAEFNPHLPIYLVRLDGMVKITNLNKLLPEAFSPKNLQLKFYNGVGHWFGLDQKDITDMIKE